MSSLLSLKRLHSKVDLAFLKHVDASYSRRIPRHYLVGTCFPSLVLKRLLILPPERHADALSRRSQRFSWSLRLQRRLQSSLL